MAKTHVCSNLGQDRRDPHLFRRAYMRLQALQSVIVRRSLCALQAQPNRSQDAQCACAETHCRSYEAHMPHDDCNESLRVQPSDANPHLRHRCQVNQNPQQSVSNCRVPHKLPCCPIQNRMNNLCVHDSKHVATRAIRILHHAAYAQEQS